MQKLRPTLALAAAAAALAVVAAAHAAPTATAQQVSVAMTEFKFTLKPASVKKGAVTFVVRNTGSVAHDFRIAGKKSAVLQPGKSGRLTVTFAKPGRYPYLCTLPSHAIAGMKGVLVVR